MPVIKYDVSDSDPEAAARGGGEPAPVGTYHAKVSSIVDEQPEGKDRRLHITYNIVEPTGYSSLHDYITFAQSQLWKMDQFLQAVGLATKTKRKGQFDPEKIKGKDVKVFVINETYDPEDGNPVRVTAKPRGVYVWDGNATGPAGVTTTPPVGQGPAAAGEEETEDPRWAEILEMDEDALSTDEVTEELVAYGQPYGLDDGDAHETWELWRDAIAEAMEADDPEAAADDGGDPDEPESEEEVDETWNSFLGMEEADLEANEETIREYASEYGIDPDTIDTWAEVVERVNDAMNSGDGGGDEEEDDDSETAAEGEGEDYNSWTLPDINGELSARGLATSGSRTQKVKRLEEDDAKKGPFDS